MTYYEQLKDPRWIERRQKIILRAASMCEYCGARDDLQVHHGVYVKGKMAWEYEDEVLYCLCKTCQWNLHEWMDMAYYEMGKRIMQIHQVLSSVKRIEFIEREYEGMDL